MSRFGPDPRDFFDTVYRETAPWDVGGPQPALSALFDEYPPTNPILDVGCGSGDLAISLAQRGLQVLGIDFVEAAISQAREKLGALPPEVARLLDFQVADALHPSRLQRQFGAVVDSGFFHLFDPDPCDRFVDELALTLRPGGGTICWRSPSSFLSPIHRARLVWMRCGHVSRERKAGISRMSGRRSSSVVSLRCQRPVRASSDFQPAVPDTTGKDAILYF